MTLFDLYRRAAERYPDEPAVSDSDGRITYRELTARALALADVLRDRGIGREQRVAVYRPRGIDAVVSVLGVLAAGAGYLPVDVRYPDDRRDYMLTDGAVSAVITPTGWSARLRDLTVPVVEWDSGDDAVSPERGPQDYVAHATPGDVACVLYTSGSTGEPKGIVLEHRNMLVWAANPALPQLEPGDRVGQVASISFDPFNYDLWYGLPGGAEIVVLPSIPDLMSGDIGRELRRRRITTMLMPAVAINHIATEDRDALSSLRVLHSGGDVLLPAACRAILGGAFRGRLFNLYGPAETTTACTGYEVTGLEDDADSVPIGSALTGYELHVLDENGEPVPDGTPGELHIAGDAVARGYLGKPELTAAKFRADPSGTGRIYASGDRVIRRADGVLVYLGRQDNQVKVQGYRVEPAEVERLLCRHDDVFEAAVLAVGPAGGHRLVAFVVGAETLQLRGLRSWLADHAPEYLVPSAIVVVPALPTDPHGKRDWTALTEAAEAHERQQAHYVAPHTDIERFLAELWEELLRVERVGIDDDFFALGGHSLLAVRAKARVQSEYGIDLEPSVLFTNSCLRDLADVLESSRVPETARSSA